MWRIPGPRVHTSRSWTRSSCRPTPQDGVNAMKFMETIADPKTSLEFNKVKGSVPIRNDVDVSSLPPYQRQASKSLCRTRFCCR